MRAAGVDRMTTYIETPGVLPPPPFIRRADDRELTVRVLSNDAQRCLLLEERRVRFSLDHLAEAGLSAREGKVLRWVAEGKTNSDIAVILSISPRTVDH